MIRDGPQAKGSRSLQWLRRTNVGLQRAGFKVIAAINSDPLAVSTYSQNHRETRAILADIRKIDPERLMSELGLERGELSLLAGCPPCQGFSSLRTLNGSRPIVEPMNDLVFEVLRFVEAMEPIAIMLENVPGLFHDDRLTRIKQSLSCLGYGLLARVFDATDFGVPQRRKRMILVALRNGEPSFAEPDGVRLTVRGAIGSLPVPAKSNDVAHNYQVFRAQHVYELISRIPKDGGSRGSLSDVEQLPCHQQLAGFSDVYGRMQWSQPSPTITGGCINPSKGRFLHPTQNRAITVREAALLQGFPEDYVIDMSRGRYPAAQLIGNAFPPAFAERHARVLKRHIARLGEG